MDVLMEKELCILKRDIYIGEFENGKSNGKGTVYTNKDDFLSKDQMIASKIIESLFPIKMQIKGEIYRQTFIVGNCKIEITFIATKSIDFGHEQKEINDIEKVLQDLLPTMKFNKDEMKLDINMIENVKKFFKTIALQIGDGKIKYSIEGDSIIIIVEIGEHSLEIKISPNKGITSYSTKFESNIYINLKNFLNMCNDLPSIDIFSPTLNLPKLII